MRKQKRTDARWFSTVLVTSFAVAANAASSSGGDATDSRISVSNVAGEVDVTMAGKAADVAPLDTVLLPARIVTGHDGTLGITQAGTNVNVASATDVEIPAEAVDGNLVARLVQHRGNVFYDVAPRDAGKLRVETPLLVAVIKGTQFNVAVQPDSTTISLFEGQLEIRTPDGSDVVQLNAGEIAIRSRTDNEIRVVGMNDERVAAPREERPAFAAALDADAAVRVPDVTSTVLLVDDAVASGGGRDLGLTAKPSVETAGLDVGFDSAVDASVNAGVDVDVGGSVDVGLDARVDLESVTVDVGLDAGVDLGAGTVDVGLDAGVDLGAGSVDVGLDAGVDLGAGTVDVGLDAGVDLGAGTVDLGLDTGVDLGAGTVDIGLDTGVDLGAGAVDLGLDAGLDAGLDLGGALDADVDAGVDLGLADVGVDAGVDLGAGTVDVDLDLGGVLDTGLDLELDLGGTLDLGLDTGGSTPSGPAPPPPSGGLGGLLGGLL